MIQWQDVTAAGGSNPAWFSYFLAGSPLKSSNGTTENFVRIGHSLLAVVVALIGGQLSRYLKNPPEISGPVPVSISNESGV